MANDRVDVRALRTDRAGMDGAYLPGLVNLSPYPGRIYSTAWRGRYPHLMPCDRAIWDRFLEAHGEDFLGVQYDILLGEGATPLTDMDEKDRRLLYCATVKRADCLLIMADKIILVEVKPRLGMAAVGQCLAYWIMWHRQYPYSPTVEVAWVGEQSEPDMQYVCDRMGFRTIVC